MAKAHTGIRDLFRAHRFCPRIGIGGTYFGVQIANVEPGSPWQGPGRLTLSATLAPEFIEFLKLTDETFVPIDLYADGESFDGKPGVSILLGGVTPSAAQLGITQLDSASGDIVAVCAVMEYASLTFIFGDNLLDKLAAAI